MVGIKFYQSRILQMLAHRYGFQCFCLAHCNNLTLHAQGSSYDNPAHNPLCLALQTRRGLCLRSRNHKALGYLSHGDKSESGWTGAQCHSSCGVWVGDSRFIQIHFWKGGLACWGKLVRSQLMSRWWIRTAWLLGTENGLSRWHPWMLNIAWQDVRLKGLPKWPHLESE